MKFGGSSVADPDAIARVARRLVAAKDNGARVVGVISAMGDTTDNLLELARQVARQPTLRELDMLLSVGEQTSCALVAMAVAELGHRSISLTGSQAGVHTDATHGNAKIVDIRAPRVRAELERDQVVLVTGFQGLGGDEITTLGRGGSDATAVALAAALGATECEIYTDVDGVYSADPRLVPDAQKLDFVNYDEMLELAAAGAAVLQLRSVELAQLHGVTLHVRSSFSETDGTRVGAVDGERFERPFISGVSHGPAEALFRIAAADHADLFAAIAAASINLDTIIRLDGEIVVSAPLADRQHVGHVLDELEVEWTERVDLSRVSVVGGGMKSHPGVAAEVFDVVRDLGLDACFVSTSPIKISFYVPWSAAKTTAQALHDRLRPGVRDGS
jgi:aspartate kinase